MPSRRGPVPELGFRWQHGHHRPLGDKYRSSASALRDLLHHEFGLCSAAIIDAVSKTLPEGGPR